MECYTICATKEVQRGGLRGSEEGVGGHKGGGVLVEAESWGLGDSELSSKYGG